MAKRRKTSWVQLKADLPGQPAGEKTIGPLMGRNGERRYRFQPGQWKEVEGQWVESLKASPLSDMFEYSDKKPKDL